MRRTVIVTLGVALLGVAGCGSSASFAQRANAACAQSNADIRKLPPPATDLAGVGQYAGELIPVASQLATSLSALTPPAASQSSYNQYVSILRAEVTGLAQMRAAALHGNVREVARAAAAIEKRGGTQIASHLGLRECARAVTPQGA